MATNQVLAELRRGTLLPSECSPGLRVHLCAQTTWPDLLVALGYQFFKVSSSRKIYILCIFHAEKTPSMRLTPDGRFFCFGCLAHGDMLDFVVGHNNPPAWRTFFARDPNQLALRYG